MRILVVEDDLITTKIVVKRAETLGHVCDVVRDGTAAWDLLCADQGVDVVVSGGQQPGLSGLELCRRLRGRSERYVPFLLVTAEEDREAQIQGMRAGADDYMVKPLDLHELHMRLIAVERLVDLHRTLERQAEQLRRLNEKLWDQGRQDAVTGIPNRRRLAEDGERLAEQAARHGLGFSVAMIDVDHFKAYNDTVGHARGDVVLKRLADAIVASCRSGDQVYRYGGEEFVLLLRTDAADDALRVCERVRSRVEGQAIAHPATNRGVVTVSVGVATRMHGRLHALDELIERADVAMYDAKRRGRNRVVLWDGGIHATTKAEELASTDPEAFERLHGGVEHDTEDDVA